MRSAFVSFLCLEAARAQWTKLSPATAPGARTVASITELEDGRVLMFGGGSPECRKRGGFCNDTWIFQDGEWTDVSDLGPAPPDRCTAAMARYGDGAVLFGGMSSKSLHANDTWIWSPTSGWREVQTPVAPPGRAYHQMSHLNGKAVLFGGTDRDNEEHDSAFGDTWVFENEAWTDLGTLEPNAPHARWGHAFTCNEAVTLPGVNDDAPGACVLTGGAALSEDDHFQDTWMYTEAGWKQVQPGTSKATASPPGRWSFMMAPCGTGALMATGSIGYRIETSDTWIFNFTHYPSVWTTDEINHDAYGDWTEQLPAQNPGELGGVMMARVKGQGVLLFGGVPMQGPMAGQDSQETWWWPESSCPGGSATSAAVV